jgi:4-hydroxybenzoate polyprenyltransferase
LLLLGRVSNLPTVWSNCLAGWLIVGGGGWPGYLQLCAGASLLYVGGMFLNDACDGRFDRAHRPERPIPSGAISGRLVWILSGAWLAGGTALLLTMRPEMTIPSLGLLAAIVVYDVVHKRTALSPLIMAACRFLLYLVAAVAAFGVVSPPLLWSAGALAAYVTGLSFVARTEAVGGLAGRWPLVLLLVPVAVAAWLHGRGSVILAVAFLLWLTLSLQPLIRRNAGAVGQVVSRLLAGIVIVDMLAVPGATPGQLTIFVLLLGSALLLQKTVPAT